MPSPDIQESGARARGRRRELARLLITRYAPRGAALKPLEDWDPDDVDALLDSNIIDDLDGVLSECMEVVLDRCDRLASPRPEPAAATVLAAHSLAIAKATVEPVHCLCCGKVHQATVPRAYPPCPACGSTDAEPIALADVDDERSWL